MTRYLITQYSQLYHLQTDQLYVTYAYMIVYLHLPTIILSISYKNQLQFRHLFPYGCSFLLKY